MTEYVRCDYVGSWRKRRWCGDCRVVIYDGPGCFCPDSKAQWQRCTPITIEAKGKAAGMTVNPTQTDRGFLRVDFVDRYDKPCSIQESSLATERAIWLGVDGQRMHLTREHVSALLPLLQRFLETGRLN